VSDPYETGNYYGLTRTAAPLDVEWLAVVAAARALRERLTIDPGNVVSWGEWDTLGAALAAIEAEARASLDVRNLMRDALSMLEDSEPLHASDDHRMWRIMDSLREYAKEPQP